MFSALKQRGKIIFKKLKLKDSKKYEILSKELIGKTNEAHVFYEMRKIEVKNTLRLKKQSKKLIKDTVTFYIIISRIIFFLTVKLYDMISKTFRNPE